MCHKISGFAIQTVVGDHVWRMQGAMEQIEESSGEYCGVDLGATARM